MAANFYLQSSPLAMSTSDFCKRLTCFVLALLACSNLQVQFVVGDDQLSSLDNAADQVEASAEEVRKLLSDPDLDLVKVLAAMKGKSAVAKNWYISVAQAVADRNPEQSAQQLSRFLTATSEDPDARYWAFSYLTRGDDEKREQLLEAMLEDPCLELRYEAVALQLDRLSESNLEPQAQLARYQELFTAARLPEQIQTIAKKLDELSSPVDLQQHFGFINTWNVAGPFDNVGGKGFDESYAPEQEFVAGKLSSDMGGLKYQAKKGEVTWQKVSTEAEDGAIDLKGSMNEEKGAVVYALGDFNAAEELACELRIGSPNAVKVWLNGELVVSRKVYHAGNQIDQYTAAVVLRSGRNEILVKSCQNEQTESWAQDWNFQLRFTDSTGLAIQPLR